MRNAAAGSAVACAVLASAAPGALGAETEAGVVDPIGIWNCVLYDDPVRGDERLVLNVVADGATYVAIQSANTLSLWQRVSSWTIDRDTLRFVDRRTGREFEADLTRGALAGSWSSDFGSGGWWCRRRGDSAVGPMDLSKAPTEFFVPQLVPEVMVSPVYPRQAIREAREGRVVACFLVDSSGTIFEPELVEVSDDVFAEPTLQVVMRSRYNALEEDVAVRPGCRSYMYELDAVY